VEKTPSDDRRPYHQPACDTTIQRGRGRPWQIPDLDLVEQLASIGCTDEEIGDAVGVSVSWITERKQDSPDFLAALKRGRSEIKSSLRRLQLSRARKGSDTMLIWLGKQMLSQRDKPEPGPDDRHHVLELIVPDGSEAITVDSDDAVPDPAALSDGESVGGDDA